MAALPQKNNNFLFLPDKGILGLSIVLYFRPVNFADKVENRATLSNSDNNLLY
jgi:hypothetical protein